MVHTHKLAIPGRAAMWSWPRRPQRRSQRCQAGRVEFRQGIPFVPSLKLSLSDPEGSAVRGSYSSTRPCSSAYCHPVIGSPPTLFGNSVITPTKTTHCETTHFQPSNPITQPIQPQTTHIIIPIFISFPISTYPYTHSITTIKATYYLTTLQQIPPQKSKLHTKNCSLSISNPQNLKNFSLDPT